MTTSLLAQGRAGIEASVESCFRWLISPATVEGLRCLDGVVSEPFEAVDDDVEPELELGVVVVAGLRELCGGFEEVGINQAVEQHVANEERLLAALSRKDREQLARLLRKLGESMRSAEEPSAPVPASGLIASSSQ